MDKKTTVLSLLPPHYTLSVLKDDHDSLHAEGWIGGKACLATIDTGASVMLARPNIAAGLPKRERPMKSDLQTSLGDSPRLKKSVSDNDSGEKPTDLGIRRRNHWWIHPGTRRHACPWCICGLRHYVLWLGDEECHCSAPGCKGVQPLHEGQRQCSSGTAMWLEGPLEAVDSIAGMGSSTTHQAEAWTWVQPARKELVTIKRDHRSQKHTQGDATSRGQWPLRQAA
jgi:hypothetical protein